MDMRTTFVLSTHHQTFNYLEKNFDDDHLGCFMDES